MKKIDEKELMKINGGFSGWVVAGIGILITFIAGVVDGLARPKKCHG